MKLGILLLSLLLINPMISRSQELTGTWEAQQGNTTTLILVVDHYISLTTYTESAFKQTRGGLLEIKDQQLVIDQEFNTAEKDLTTEEIPFEQKGDQLILQGLTFDRLDDGGAPLAGTWHITGRMNDGQMQQIHQSGTRKTLKMLTGTRFQWFAIDPNGNQFFGTGGGAYVFENGTYTEKIRFFSRDSTRVGASLSFDGELQDGKWHHSGLSSTGQPISEIWERID